MSLSPRRCRWGRRRSGEQRLDIRRRWDKVVGVELEVPVAPVDLPFPTRLRVAQPGDRESCPIGAEVGPPRRPTLEDRHGTVVNIDLVADLVASALGQSRVALIDPASNAGQVSFGKCHVAPRSPTSRRTEFGDP